MSSVGFTFQSKDIEIDKLREAFQSVTDCIRGIADAESCIDILNFGSAKDHLKAARWHAGEAKKAIAVLGQAKKANDQK